MCDAEETKSLLSVRRTVWRLTRLAIIDDVFAVSEPLSRRTRPTGLSRYGRGTCGCSESSRERRKGLPRRRHRRRRIELRESWAETASCDIPMDSVTAITRARPPDEKLENVDAYTVLGRGKRPVLNPSTGRRARSTAKDRKENTVV